MVRDGDDEILGVLKIANPAFNATELEAQDAAADLIAEAEPSLRIAVPLPNVAGEKCTAITGLLDRHRLRAAAALPARRHSVRSGYLPPAAVAGLGEVAGRVSRALAGFDHPGLDRALQWDLRYGADVVARTAFACRRSARRARVEDPRRLRGRGSRRWPTRCPGRRSHLDLTDANVVVSRGADGAAHPDGVIDFGDLSHTLGGVRVGDHGVVGARASGHRSDLDPARSPGVSRHPTVDRRGGRGAVADAGAAHRGADRQRSTAGRARPRQRVRHRADRRRNADVRAGHLGADRRDDRGDHGGTRARA